MLLPPVLGRTLLLPWPLFLSPVLGRTLPLSFFLLSPVVGRTEEPVPVAERLPVLALITVPPVPWLPLVVGRTVVLVEPLVLRELLPLFPVEGRTVVELLPLVERVPVVVVVLLTCGVTLVADERPDEVLLLVTVAALFLGAEATLRLPVAAALLVDAGRRPCAIAPVEVMASPQTSIKPIIVL